MHVLQVKKWIWQVRSYLQDGTFCQETVHASDASKDMEVKAAESIGRRVEIVNLKELREEVLARHKDKM